MGSKSQAADLVLQGLAHMVHRDYHLAKRSFILAQQLNPDYPGLSNNWSVLRRINGSISGWRSTVRLI